MIGEAIIKKKCPVCGKQFETVWPRQKYCSVECHQGMATCIVCGKKFLIKPRTTANYCSLQCWYKHYKVTGKKIKICPICDKQFHGKNLTCSQKCGYALVRQRNPNRRITCEHCGKPLDKHVHPKRRFCSRSCAVAHHNKFGGHVLPEGSKYMDGTGYIRIKVKGNWIQEHRYLMGLSLGRLLKPTERVHHKNGNRADNRLENLELWTTSKKDPPGKRVIDWVIDYLREQGWKIDKPLKEAK